MNAGLLVLHNSIKNVTCGRLQTFAEVAEFIRLDRSRNTLTLNFELSPGVQMFPAGQLSGLSPQL
jgi:hypothetical protein